MVPPYLPSSPPFSPTRRGGRLSFIPPFLSLLLRPRTLLLLLASLGVLLLLTHEDAAGLRAEAGQRWNNVGEWAAAAAGGGGGREDDMIDSDGEKPTYWDRLPLKSWKWPAWRTSSSEGGTAAGEEEGSLVDSDRLQEEASKAEAALEGALTLPICERTLFYQLPGLHGFASTYLTYIRVSSLASYYNFTLLTDDSQWNYGSLRTYFDVTEPEDLPLEEGGCRRPAAWREMKRKRALKRSGDSDDEKEEEGAEKMAWSVSRRDWERATDELWSRNWNHTRMHSKAVEALDLSILNRHVPLDALTSLHASDRTYILKLASLFYKNPRMPAPHPLKPTDTLPDLWAEAFTVQMLRVRKAWTVSSLIEREVSHLHDRLALPPTTSTSGEESVRRRRRSLSDAVVAMHMRMGDKALEVRHMTPLRFLGTQFETDFLLPIRRTFAQVRYPWEGLRKRKYAIKIFMEAAERALAEIREEFDELEQGRKPTLVIMSDDKEVVDEVRTYWKAKTWRVVSPNEVPLIEDDRQRRRRERRRRRRRDEDDDGDGDGDGDSDSDAAPTHALGAADYTPPMADAPTFADDEPYSSPSSEAEYDAAAAAAAHAAEQHASGFDENVWNAMSESDRLREGTSFVRDLTLTSRVADAIVITPTSNVGRLWALMFAGRWAREEEYAEIGAGLGGTERAAGRGRERVGLHGEGKNGLEEWDGEIRWEKHGKETQEQGEGQEVRNERRRRADTTETKMQERQWEATGTTAWREARRRVWSADVRWFPTSNFF